MWGVTGTRLLAAIGLNDVAEDAYQALLRHPGATAADLAALLDRPSRQVRIALEDLAARGLVDRSAADHPSRYHAAPPEPAIDALVRAQQRELAQALGAVAKLRQRMREASARYRPPMSPEILAGSPVVAARIEALLHDARQEILLIDQPPYPAPEGSWSISAQRTALERGVVINALYDNTALEQPGRAEQVYQMMRAGQRVRVYLAVPSPLLVVDGEVAVIPFDSADPEPGALLIGASNLLDTVLMFFRLLWDRGTPLYLPEDGAGPDLAGRRALNQLRADRLVPLLAAGLGDEAISQQLGISARTLDRRMHALLSTLHAGTRFQAGWLAWLRYTGTVRPAEGADGTR